MWGHVLVGCGDFQCRLLCCLAAHAHPEPELVHNIVGQTPADIWIGSRTFRYDT
jgi:hypothetical protein